MRRSCASSSWPRRTWTPTPRSLAADFARAPMRCTLYTNTEDCALAASDWKHGGYTRDGGGGNDLLVLPSIDTN